MTNTEDTIVTFTNRSFETIEIEQEDRAWILNEDRAKFCKYLVCCHSEGEKRGTAFLVGKIRGIRFSHIDLNTNKKRRAIQVSELASIDLPNIWGGWQNPVHYTTLEDIGINISTLTFRNLATNNIPLRMSVPDQLTITQAKAGLSQYYGVSLENIEILIKG